ncbi:MULTISPECIES: hypothetical protein [Streptomyces]|uniref:hypothetical protein n=1 Tax=Streptomyces TaxID=1883 RepID=UPI000A9D5B91|nr:hypothetical protein [Streptomyces sp. CB00072]
MDASGNGRRLLSAVEMRVGVAEFVRRVTARKRLPLDYSVASLRVVDRIVDGLRAAGPEQGAVAGELFWLGAYAGEVLVRRAGAEWVDFDLGQRELFGQVVGVRMPDGRAWNPIGKVTNRFAAGPEESVQQMYFLLHGRPRMPTMADR